MRTLFIVELLEDLEAIHLLAQRARRRFAVSCNSVRCSRSSRPFCCGLPGAIRSGNTPALITLTDSFDSPPTPREAKRAPLSERRPLGRPNSRKAASRPATHDRRRSAHDLAAQEIAALRIAQRQRLAMRAVASEKPALEVHAPHVVGCTAMRKGTLESGLRRRKRRLTVKPSRSNSAPIVLAAGHSLCGTHRTSHARTFAGPQVGCARRTAKHRSATASIIACGWLSGARERFDESFNASLIVSPKPLVTGLAADSEAPAHRRERLFSLLNRHHKTHPFVHSMGLRPSHRQGPPCRSVDLLPMSSVYSVTHVPGLDPPNPSPQGGGEPTEFAACAGSISTRQR